MKITRTAIADVLLIEPAVHGDARGWFSETWQAQRYVAAGVTSPFRTGQRPLIQPRAPCVACSSKPYMSHYDY